MLQYDLFYKKYIVRKSSDLLGNPITIDKIKWPIYSTFLWPGYLNKDIPDDNDIIFVNNDYGTFINIYEPYKITEHKFRLHTNFINKIKNETKNNIANFFIIKFDKAEKVKNKKYSIIVNTGPLLETTDYNGPDYLKDVYSKQDRLESLIHYSIDNFKNRYMFLTVPLYTDGFKYNEFVSVLKKSDKYQSEYFNTMYKWVFREIFMLLFREFEKDSVLYKFKDYFNKINLIFYKDSKAKIINLEDLYSLSKDNNIISKNGDFLKYTPKKTFILLNTLLTKTYIEGKINDEIDLKVSDNINEDELETLMDLKEEEIVKQEESKIVNLDVKDVEEVLTLIPKETEELDVIFEDILTNSKVSEKKKQEVIKELDVSNKKFDIESKLEEKDFEINEEEVKLPDNEIVKNKKLLRDTISVTRKKFNTKIYDVYKKQIIYVLERAGFILKDFFIEENKTNINETETLVFTIKPITGGSSLTRRIIIPKLKDDGTFIISGNKYKLRFQRSDIPIRKISSKQVSLSSYYGKVFISKSDMEADDPINDIVKQLKTMLSKKEISLLVYGKSDIKDIELPQEYMLLSRKIKSFNKNGYLFVFNYMILEKYLPRGLSEKKILNGINGKNIIGINNKDNKYILINKNNMLYEFNYKTKKLTDLNINLFNYISLDESKIKAEYTNIRIFKERFPTGLLLAYYYGFDKLIKLLKVDYKEYGPRERVKEENYFEIKFKNKKLVFNKTKSLSTLILYGFVKLNKHLKNLDSFELNNKSGFKTLFTLMNMSIRHINELDNLKQLFIDPMTRNTLKLLKEPVTFEGLLFKANIYLENDISYHTNNMKGNMLKLNERILGMVYKDLVTAIVSYKNQKAFGRPRLNINPYSVMSRIVTDSTVMLVDDLNPIIELKQNEDVTFTGEGGRVKESMTAPTRELHETELGIISEASKDSQDVGITAYTTAAPNIKTVNGLVEVDDSETIDPIETLSTSLLLAPFATTDDPKRMGFISIQNGHVIPFDDSTIMPVRTGYETVLGFRVSKKYALVAREKCKVIKKTKDIIEVEYKNGRKDSCHLGVWFTKDKSGTSYKHNVVSDRNKGDIIEPGMYIAYDETSFTKDIFNRDRVIMKTGNFVKTVLVETTETYEDSAAISKKLYKEFSTSNSEIKSFILHKDDEVLNHVNIGDKVDVRTPLFNKIKSELLDNDIIDKDNTAMLKSLINFSPKAEVKGKVVGIEVRYNCEYDELSKTLKELADEGNKYLQKINHNSKITGQVDNSFSYKGRILEEGDVLLKIIIEHKVPMSLGDKGVFGNQLKFTVGEVFDYKILDEEGNEVDAMFSNKSIGARIVNSPYLTGILLLLIEKANKNAIEAYFG